MLKTVIWILAAAWQPLAAWAGGSGLNVVVVVNQNSTNSVQLGNDYCEKRGVPPQNLFRMTNWTGGNVTWLRNEFEGDLLDPLLAMLNSSGMTNQVQYVLLSMDIPYRVMSGDSANSTTSALFYGFKTNDPAPSPDLPVTCSLPDASSNGFAFSELPFEMAKPNTADTNSLLAFMLSDESLSGAETILSRALAADSSFPTQTVYLEKTSDWARNVRYFGFDNAIFESRVRGDTSVVRITSDSTSFNGIRGLLTGFVTLSLPTNSFVPGALGDSLTSLAGYLFENSSGQTTLLEFLHAGADASYGAVIEPCNFTQKFPDPLVFFYQGRGFSTAEAYYLSLLNPFQGIFVGEPLCAPFARVGQASWPGLNDGTVLQGLAALPPAMFSSAAPDLPIGQIDLFVDGTFARTLTNTPPSAGNLLTLNVNGSSIPYVVPMGATVPSVAAGLADAVNMQSNSLKVAAFPVGDRVEFQGMDPSVSGSNILLSAAASAGSSQVLTTAATPASPNLLDTIATGAFLLGVSNSPVQGDWLQLQITKTNGAQISISVTNSTADTSTSDLCSSLLAAMNATPELQGTDGVLGGDLYPDPHLVQFLIYAREPGWQAAQIKVTLTSSPDLVVWPVQNNSSDLRPRDHLDVSAGLNDFALPFTLDTTKLSDGFHELTLVGYEGTSVRTQTRLSRKIQVHNTNLSATLAPQLIGTNITVDTPLSIVISTTNAISTIQLFSTGGLLDTVSNQASVTFQVPTSLLGVGLHPFYAVVTDNLGNQFRTQTTSIRILPSLQLSIGGQPLTLSWNSFPGAIYDILVSSNLVNGFQKAASVTATNTTAQWPVQQNGNQAFYRVGMESN